jgi:hypothetical protein
MREGRVLLVEIVDRDAVEVAHAVDQPAVHPRSLEDRVREDDQDAPGHALT